MDQKKMLFIYNPYAGKAKIRNNLIDIIDIFVKGGYEVTTYPTQGPKDAIQVSMEKAPEYDLIVCSGGDGTLDEVVTGMMQSEKKLPIGYIPAGSTNDFANSLKIPMNMKKAASVIVDGKKYACDVGSFNEETFIYVAAFGMFTDVSYGTRQEMKNALGHAAYILEGTKRIPALESYHMRVEYDDTVIEDEFMFGMISNSFSIGGIKNITGKDVILDDGFFEITLIKRPRLITDLQNIVKAMLLLEADSKYVYAFKAKELTITTENDVKWTLDGEYGGMHRHVKLQNMKHAVQIIVPNRHNS